MNKEVLDILLTALYDRGRSTSNPNKGAIMARASKASDTSSFKTSSGETFEQIFEARGYHFVSREDCEPYQLRTFYRYSNSIAFRKFHGNSINNCEPVIIFSKVNIPTTSDFIDLFSADIPSDNIISDILRQFDYYSSSQTIQTKANSDIMSIRAITRNLMIPGYIEAKTRLANDGTIQINLDFRNIYGKIRNTVDYFNSVMNLIGDIFPKKKMFIVARNMVVDTPRYRVARTDNGREIELQYSSKFDGSELYEDLSKVDPVSDDEAMNVFSNFLFQSLKKEQVDLEKRKTSLLKSLTEVGTRLSHTNLLLRSKKTVKDNVLASIRKIPNIGGVKNYFFTNEDLVVNTNPIYYTPEEKAQRKVRTATPILIGEFEIRLSLLDGKLILKNLQGMEKILHPHISSSGHCSGGYPEMMISALSEARYDHFIAIIMDMLSSVNESDSIATSRLREMKETKKRGSVSVVILEGSKFSAKSRPIDNEVELEDDDEDDE